VTTPNGDPLFAGSIPELYDRHLVPLIFEPYAHDLAHRLTAEPARTVLEIAAGTGVATRAMADHLPHSVSITATDLNRPMVDHAAHLGTSRAVTWLAADALALPFPDGAFDAVVCQFGVMFFPERIKAYHQIARVLQPGGLFLFNVWDRLEANEFAHAVTDGVARVFPGDPPRFLPRTPHGYYEEAVIQAELEAAGFEVPARFDMLEARSVAAGPDIPAIAYCQGTPLRNEIEERDPASLAVATATAADVVRDRFGERDVDGRIRGFAISARRR
jgi:ubiquinone/menaquinone biosynthesis C-methylase UbiE